MRSCYSARANFFADGTRKDRRIIWYFVPPETPIYEEPTVFWPRSQDLGDTSGGFYEQSYRTRPLPKWRNGYNEWGFTGDHVHGDPEDFAGESLRSKYFHGDVVPGQPCEGVQALQSGIGVGSSIPDVVLVFAPPAFAEIIFVSALPAVQRLSFSSALPTSSGLVLSAKMPPLGELSFSSALPTSSGLVLSASLPAASVLSFSAALPAVERLSFSAALPAVERLAFSAALPARSRLVFSAALPAVERLAFSAALPPAEHLRISSPFDPVADAGATLRFCESEVPVSLLEFE